MQRLDGRVDAVEAVEGVGDVGVEAHLAAHDGLDEAGHLGPRLPAAERGALPLSTGHQLEGSATEKYILFRGFL